MSTPDWTLNFLGTMLCINVMLTVITQRLLDSLKYVECKNELIFCSLP